MPEEHQKTTITLSTSRNYLPIQGNGLPLYLSVDIKAPEVEKNAFVNLVLVIDCSGSMIKNWLNLVVTHCKDFINLLDPEDYCSIVVFAEKAIILSQGKIENFRQEILSSLNSINQISPFDIGGGSNLSEALITGQIALEKLSCPQNVNRVILITDITDRNIESSVFCLEKTLPSSAITTIGVGDLFDENLLMTIAEKSGGNYYYGSSPSSIIKHLTKELAWLRTITIKATTLDYSFLTGIDLVEFFFISPISFPIVCQCKNPLKSSIKLGDLSGTTLTRLLVELFVVPNNFSTDKLAIFTLLAKDNDKIKQLAKAEISFSFTTNQTLIGQINTQVMLLVENACLIKIKIEVNKALAKGNIKKVFFLLKSLKMALIKLGQVDLVSDLDFLLKSLSSEGQIEIAKVKALTVGLRAISTNLLLT